MKKTTCFAALLGMLLLPCASFAQTPEVDSFATPATTADVPADQQPTKEQLAKLFDVMRIKKQLASVTMMMPEVMMQQMGAQMKEMEKTHPEIASMTDEQKQAASKVMSKHMMRAITLYTSDEMTADISEFYQKHLSRSDVDDIISFYSSPAGQHMLDILPNIMKWATPKVNQRMQERIKSELDEMTKEMGEIVKPQTSPTDKPAAK